MFEQLDVFRMSSAMAIHAGQRQAIASQNVANSDTPGYVAKDIAAFETLYQSSRDGTVQRATRTGHLNGSVDGMQVTEPFEVRDEASPNGNAVSLETEMLRSLDAKRQHDRSLAIYKSALSVLRSTIGK
ncbi:FlgB family protein [Roseobacter sp. GAI101]|uniref:FlgB family protein n=1 Tax=Roseobacter sp. (strain GAI101) TaxID=391589 RepID=UPI0002F561B1|nr:FlgB family protein [Roseobacter sp. GAI101]